jgi:hypothetical protein
VGYRKEDYFVEKMITCFAIRTIRRYCSGIGGQWAQKAETTYRFSDNNVLLLT